MHIYVCGYASMSIDQGQLPANNLFQVEQKITVNPVDGSI